VGGHLGASLGAVELIVALHRVYRTPVDRLVFDVGHQAYAHKLLTGRAPRMSTLRQADGIAPFLDPSESEHDAFGAGHACTAVSVAVGMLEGLQHTGAPGQVVAIVGDGALTGGLSFEGLNHAAVASRGLVVVLNDNGMSISTNVGAVRAMLEHDARRFFEAMGFVYVGVLDGHDVHGLVAALRGAKGSAKPVVVHVRTQKGRGFAPAEEDTRTRGHAMGPYELRAGKLVRSRGGLTTWSEAFAEVLRGRLEADPRAVVITPAMLEGSALTGLAAQFPRRVFDVGIAEQHAVTFAAGLATTGVRPIVCIYSTFLQRAYDQLVHDIARGSSAPTGPPIRARSTCRSFAHCQGFRSPRRSSETSWSRSSPRRSRGVARRSSGFRAAWCLRDRRLGRVARPGRRGGCAGRPRHASPSSPPA
jgi:1-deoxy-D-xylulose-5-phosphate synthase